MIFFIIFTPPSYACHVSRVMFLVIFLISTKRLIWYVEGLVSTGPTPSSIYIGHYDKKLDGVGPVDNRPSTDKLHHFVKKINKNRNKKIKKYMWHVTCDTWHVTRDMWQVTRDTSWHVTCLVGWTFSQNFSSLALTVCDSWYYEDLEEKDDSANEWRGCL